MLQLSLPSMPALLLCFSCATIPTMGFLYCALPEDIFSAQSLQHKEHSHDSHLHSQYFLSHP